MSRSWLGRAIALLRRPRGIAAAPKLASSDLRPTAGLRPIGWWLVGSTAGLAPLRAALAGPAAVARVIAIDGTAPEPPTPPAELRRLKREIEGFSGRIVLVANRPASLAVALATYARARGARVVYQKTEAWETRGSARLELEEDTLVGLADHLIADDVALGRLLRSRERGTGLVHVAATPAERVTLLASLAARPSLTLLIAPAEPGEQLDAALAALLRHRAELAYGLAIVLLGAAGEDVEEHLAEQGGAARRVLRRGATSRAAAQALAQRATGGEIVGVLSPEQRPCRDDWCTAAVALLLERGEVGAVALLDHASDQPTCDLEVLPASGFFVRRDVLAAAQGFAEDLPEHAEVALSLRIRQLGFALIGVPARGLLDGALARPACGPALLRRIARRAGVALGEPPAPGHPSRGPQPQS